MRTAKLSLSDCTRYSVAWFGWNRRPPRYERRKQNTHTQRNQVRCFFFPVFSLLCYYGVGTLRERPTRKTSLFLLQQSYIKPEQHFNADPTYIPVLVCRTSNFSWFNILNGILETGMKTEILINATNTYNQLSIMEYAAKCCSVRTTIIGTIFYTLILSIALLCYYILVLVVSSLL